MFSILLVTSKLFTVAGTLEWDVEVDVGEGGLGQKLDTYRSSGGSRISRRGAWTSNVGTFW